MKYHFREDVVLEQVGGIYMLIALRTAWGECPFAVQIAPVSACFWRGIKEGKDSEEIIERAAAERNLQKERVSRFFSHFIKAAQKYHYVISGESDR